MRALTNQELAFVVGGAPKESEAPPKHKDEGGPTAVGVVSTGLSCAMAMNRAVKAPSYTTVLNASYTCSLAFNTILSYASTQLSRRQQPTATGKR